jgi:hypothetical protein
MFCYDSNMDKAFRRLGVRHLQLIESDVVLVETDHTLLFTAKPFDNRPRRPFQRSRDLPYTLCALTRAKLQPLTS